MTHLIYKGVTHLIYKEVTLFALHWLYQSPAIPLFKPIPFLAFTSQEGWRDAAGNPDLRQGLKRPKIKEQERTKKKSLTDGEHVYTIQIKL